MDIEVAKLWLNGSQLSTTQTQAGVRSANCREYTFFINMRVVLGETLFSKYDAFKCFINAYNYGNSGTTQSNTTLYQNGLNLVNASYQGNTPGYNTAVSVYNQTTLGGVPPNYFIPQNTREFVMIKPNDQLIPLTFTIVSDDGIASALLLQMWQLTFTPIPATPEKIYRNPLNRLIRNEQANFTLSTQILTTGGTNVYGTMNAIRTIFTFTNVDMRRIIGTLWDKYNKFNLVWNSVGLAQVATAFNNSQRQMFFQLSGLQFINTVAVKSGTANSAQGLGWSPMFFFNAASTADANIFDSPGNMITFRKPESERVDLTFELFSANSGGTPITATMNQTTITFSVIGVNE